MAKCFVMQPFHKGVFDKRYDDVFAPAIRDAGLEPYRVDRDPGVSIPIQDIESGIRDSELCFAEITTDNPNVWFELGFAIAVPKEVVLVCSDGRTSPFPFDVQHRSIIQYKTDSTQDFKDLQDKITKRIVALVNKQREIGKVSQISPVKETEGLSQHEIVALVTVMQNQFISDSQPSGWRIKEDMNKAGFADIAVSLALRTLMTKGMITAEEMRAEDGSEYIAYSTTATGESWVIHNQDRLILRRPGKEKEETPF